jgi:hypothetical protein
VKPSAFPVWILVAFRYSCNVDLSEEMEIDLSKNMEVDMSKNMELSDEFDSSSD